VIVVVGFTVVHGLLRGGRFCVMCLNQV